MRGSSRSRRRPRTGRSSPSTSVWRASGRARRPCGRRATRRAAPCWGTRCRSRPMGCEPRTTAPASAEPRADAPARRGRARPRGAGVAGRGAFPLRRLTRMDRQAVARLAREHAPLLAVLAAAAMLRVGVALAYRPGLFFIDSWGYLDVALRADPVGFAPERPSGYPLLLNLLFLPGRSIALVTAVQHLAGLATGVLAYILLLRLGARRGIAAAAAGVVLFDSYAVALEQHLLTEAFFGLTLLSAGYTAIVSRGALGLALSGSLLGVAITMRTAGLFALPVWLVYLAWSRRGLGPSAAGAAALLVLVCGYAALHARGDPTRHANPNTFSLTEMDGWYLYAKTAGIADCDGAEIPARARPLCQPPQERSRDAEFYLFNTA